MSFSGPAAIVKALWPFVKEVILQSDELKTAFRENLVNMVLGTVCLSQFMVIVVLYTQGNQLTFQLDRRIAQAEALEEKVGHVEVLYKDRLDFQERYFEAIGSSKDYQIELLNKSLKEKETETAKLKEEITALRKSPARTNQSPKSSKDYLDRLDKIKRH